MNFLRLLGRALRLWVRQGADQHAAALAYFTPFALTPLIIFSITIIGLVFGTGRLVTMLVEWGNSIDEGVTTLIYQSVQNFDVFATFYYWPVVGLVFLSLMIYVTLNSLTAGLHAVWSVDARGWKNFFRRLWRMTLFVAVLQIYLVTLLLLKSAFLWATAVTGWQWWSVVSFFTGLLLTVGLLTIAYGLLALAAPTRSARLVGAAVAAVVLLFSRELVAIHFSTAPVQSLFGAAGLLISLMVWVYVVAGIILFGASVARAYDESLDLRGLSR